MDQSPLTERTFQTAVDNANDGVVITDPRLPDNPIVYANKAFYNLTGYTPEDIIGKNCRFLQKEDRNQEGIGTIRDAITSSEPCRVTVKNYKKDGTLFINELSISPVIVDGKTVNFIGIQHDVTKEKDHLAMIEKLNSLLLEREGKMAELKQKLASLEDPKA